MPATLLAFAAATLIMAGASAPVWTPTEDKKHADALLMAQASSCDALEREHWEAYCEADYVACLQARCAFATTRKQRENCQRQCQSRQRQCVVEHCRRQ